MFIGRTQELKQLEEAYRAEKNTAVVLYGRWGVGKTELAKTFIKDKPAVFYAAKELSEQEQCFLLKEELLEETGTEVPEMYETIKAAVARKKPAGQKIVLVFDEFHHMLSTGRAFWETFITLMNETEEPNYMLLLLSSSVNWVENDMVSELVFGAKLLTGIIKLKELSFVEMVNRFPHMPVENAIYANAVLGGVPAYLEYWEEEMSVEENIRAILFEKNAPLLYGAEHFLKSELRELGAYNAILTALASGKYKLNDIYARTGFSRAKISVYIKNLIELDIVEKIFSYDAAEHTNVQKGLYRLKDKFLCFWYRYVFPNLSAILAGEGKRVYDTKLLPTFDSYLRECFGSVCAEYLKLMSQYDRLEGKYTTWGNWYGKNGLIDIVAGDKEGNTLVAFCRFDNQRIAEADYREYLDILASATLEPQEFYIFSKAGFEAEMEKKAEQDKLHLVRLEDL